MVSAVTGLTYQSIGIGFYFLVYNIIYTYYYGIYLLINIAVVYNLLTARLITQPTTAPNFFGNHGSHYYGGV